ncbi:hypothetical protein SEA_SATIS_107 [Streptomyces phage Satis]|nr:hypothetical protein SEA_SATIS_107 [Streptomyces phage Satis]
MQVRMRAPQLTGVRRSVEVQHGRKGVGRMLRRGLHGSKNWVLETDDMGEHRSVWSKLFRAVVVLAPVWIVVSAFTGGPERGGKSVSVFQTLFMTVLVTVVGLAVFSARERRLGREEPWLDFTSDDTDGDDGESATKVDPTPEAPTQVLENSQVGDVEPEENSDESDRNSGDSADSAQNETQVLQPMVHQATFPEAENPVIPGSEAPTQVVPEVMHQAITEGANQEEPDRAFEAIASVANDFHEEGMQEASPESRLSLVKDDIPAMQPVVQKATPDWADVDTSGTTESEEGLIEDEPTTPLRAVVQDPVQEAPSATPSVQVSDPQEPVQHDVQGVLQVHFAQPGPYPQNDDPVHEQWWVVAPDIEPEEAAEEPEEAPAEVPSVPVPEIHVEQQQAAPLPQIGRHPQAVLTYLASQAPKSGFTPEEKERARLDVLSWLREVTESKELSRAEAARRIGVDASTVSRWLSDDPWTA